MKAKIVGGLAVVIFIIGIVYILNFNQNKILPCLGEAPALIDAPGGDIWGVECNDSFIWSATTDGQLYKMSNTGEVLRQYSMGHFNTGLAWDGKNLWYSTYNLIVKLDAEGKIIQQFDYPQMGGSLKWVTGLAWDGRSIWFIDREDKTLNRINSDGNITKTVKIQGENVNLGLLNGLDYDGKNFWAIAAPGNLLRLDKNGKILENYSLPGQVSVEVAWFRGNTFLIADVDGNNIQSFEVKTSE